MPIAEAPGRLPAVGHGLQMTRKPLAFLTRLPPLGPVVLIRLGALPVYVINDGALARQVLTGSYDQGVLVEKARPLLGDGVGMLNGEAHRTHRRIMQPSLSRQRIAGYAAAMTRLADERTRRWSDGQRLELDQEMNELALVTVATTLFSADLAEAVAEVQRSLPIVLDQLPRRAVLPAPLLRLPSPANRRFDRAAAALHRVTREAVTASRAHGTDTGDLVSTLLLTRDQETGAGLTGQQVHDQLVNMMVAGTETTGASLAWVFHELARHPAIEQRLHAELDQVLDGRAAAFEDLPALPYTQKVVLETLRLYPPYLILRHAPNPSTLGPAELPAGAAILISPYVLHRDPDVFPDPERFDPDREVPRTAAIPFGAGGRQCPGNHFALTEMALHTATIAARWRFRPDRRVPVRPVARGAAVHPSALPVTAEWRTHAGLCESVGGAVSRGQRNRRSA
jgi:cytochrome P450